MAENCDTHCSVLIYRALNGLRSFRLLRVGYLYTRYCYARRELFMGTLVSDQCTNVTAFKNQLHGMQPECYICYPSYTV